MSRSVITVIGKDRIGIVRDVSALLAEQQINILNISQQLMDDYFTMIILVDVSGCLKSRADLAACLAAESQRLVLDIRIQDEALFDAMHRI